MSKDSTIHQAFQVLILLKISFNLKFFNCIHWEFWNRFQKKDCLLHPIMFLQSLLSEDSHLPFSEYVLTVSKSSQKW